MSEEEQKKENIFQKGWNDFVGGIKDGFGKFQESLEEAGKKNQENMEKFKEKSGKFFKKMKTDWDNQLLDCLNCDRNRFLADSME